MVTKLSALKNVWKTVIGLEIHAQLNTKTKLFSIAPNKFDSPPNCNVAYFDMAMPGTLPIINSKCVELAILAACVLKCEINYSSEFDRKHYFYGDMPSGYQITQHRKPIAQNGNFSFLWNYSQNSTSYKDVQQSNVRILEIHIEQDSGKSLHDYDHNMSLIDLNRAGVGLLEVVTDCQFEHPLQAVGFVKELRDVFIQCGICTGQMEEGELRVDANISVCRHGSDELGDRCEVKNINSLRGVLKAIEFESARQIALLQSDQCVINETRLYDPATETTISMRDKESVQDYRYFPEPNLPTLILQRSCQSQVDGCTNHQTCVPCIAGRLSNFIYPNEKNQLLVSKFCLTLNQCYSITSEPNLYEYLLATSDFKPSNLSEQASIAWMRLLGTYILTVFLGGLRARQVSVKSCPIHHGNFAQLVTMTFESKINPFVAPKIFSKMLDEPNASPQSITKTNRLEQISDPQIIEQIVREFVNKNQKALQDYKAGNKRVSRFFKKTIKSENKDLINHGFLNSIIDKILNEKM